MSQTSQPPVGSYRFHQETAAAACMRLLGTDRLPHDVALQFRRVALDALDDRLTQVGERSSPSDPPLEPTLERLVDRPAAVLASTVRHTARTPAAEAGGVSTGELLTTPRGESATEAWRQLAVHLLAGNQALATAQTRPWEVDRATAWPIVGDVAATFETILVLDRTFVDVGLLEGVDTRQHRITAAHCGRLAAQYGDPAGSDLAVAVPDPEDVPWGVTSLQFVHEPGDLAAAQRELGQGLRHRRGLADGFGQPASSMDVDTFVAFVSVQHRLCVTAAAANDQVPGNGDLAGEFARRGRLLASLKGPAQHLVQMEPPDGPHQAALWQLSELSRGLYRFAAPGRGEGRAGAATGPGLADLDRGGMVDLLAATHVALTHGAAAAHDELLRDASTIRVRGLADPAGEVGRSQVVATSPIARNLTAIATTPAPGSPPGLEPAGTRGARDQLRGVLDQTPTPGPVTPPPYPSPRLAPARGSSRTSSTRGTRGIGAPAITSGRADRTQQGRGD